MELVVAAAGLALTVYWMVVGWRGMRALERLAETVDAISGRR